MCLGDIQELILELILLGDREEEEDSWGKLRRG